MKPDGRCSVPLITHPLISMLRTEEMKPVTAALAIALLLMSTVTYAEQPRLQQIFLGGDPGPFNPSDLPPTNQPG